MDDNGFMDEQERAIFCYHNGTRLVWADPLTIQRRLEAALGDYDAVVADMRSQDIKVAASATECYIANARDVLGMPAIDPDSGQGTTERQVRKALESFYDCLKKKETTTAGSPTSSPATM
jgi:hypothetical protein